MPPKKGNSGNSGRGNGGTANNGRGRGGSSGRRRAPADDDDALLDAAIEAAESARAVIRDQDGREAPTEDQDSARRIVQEALGGTEVQWLYTPTGQQRPFLASELTKKAVLADPRLMPSTHIYYGTGIRMVMAQSCKEMVQSMKPHVEAGLAKGKTMTGRQTLALQINQTIEVPTMLMYMYCSNLQQQQQNPPSQQQPRGVLMIEMEGFSIEQVIGPKAVEKRHVTVAYLTNDAFKALMVKRQERNDSVSAEGVQKLVFNMTESNTIPCCVAYVHDEGCRSERGYTPKGYAHTVLGIPFQNTTKWKRISSKWCAMVGLHDCQAMQLEFDGPSLSDIVCYDGNQKGFMTFISHEKK